MSSSKFKYVKINNEAIVPAPIKDEPDKGRGQTLFPGSRFPNVVLCAQKDTGKSAIIEHICKHYFTKLTPKDKQRLSILILSKNAFEDQRWIGILEFFKKEKLDVKVRELMHLTEEEKKAAAQLKPQYVGDDFLEFFVHKLRHQPKEPDPEKRQIYHLFFDDQTKATRSNAMTELLSMNRHKFCWTCVAEQDWDFTNQDGRLQYNFAMIGYGMPDDRLKQVHADMSVRIPFEDFRELYNDVCPNREAYGFLHINKATGNFRRGFSEAIVVPSQDASIRETKYKPTSHKQTGVKRKRTHE